MLQTLNTSENKGTGNPQVTETERELKKENEGGRRGLSACATRRRKFLPRSTTTGLDLLDPAYDELIVKNYKTRGETVLCGQESKNSTS